ncbi:MAG: class E sortase, partial [Candidatus Gracilibacteria bacterium]|nr:class E sortase [Candidatus Gracilibacteria bacterium]
SKVEPIFTEEKLVFSSADAKEHIINERKISKGLLVRVFFSNMKLGTDYIITSTVIFIVLFAISNFSAYSSIITTYLNPSKIKASGQEIFNSLNSGKINVYAKEEEKESESIKKMKEKILSNKYDDKKNYLNPENLVLEKEEISMNVDIAPYENRVIIPKIGKNIPLVNVDIRRSLDKINIQDIFAEELKKGVIRYPGTGTPGDVGNVFIFGHSSNLPWIKGDYNDVFALLDNLENGDEIIAYYNQRKYVYVVKNKQVVKPGDVDVVNAEEGKKELSIVTCWPVGTTRKRLVVSTELKEITNN